MENDEKLYYCHCQLVHFVVFFFKANVCIVRRSNDYMFECERVLRTKYANRFNNRELNEKRVRSFSSVFVLLYRLFYAFR